MRLRVEQSQDAESVVATQARYVVVRTVEDRRYFGVLEIGGDGRQVFHGERIEEEHLFAHEELRIANPLPVDVEAVRFRVHAETRRLSQLLRELREAGRSVDVDDGR